jgi:hypothetical protein
VPFADSPYTPPPFLERNLRGEGRRGRGRERERERETTVDFISCENRYCQYLKTSFGKLKRLKKI